MFDPEPDSNWGIKPPQLEQPDGRLLAVFVWSQSTVVRWNEDGTRDPSFAPDIVGGYAQCSGQQSLHLVKGDQVFVAGTTVTSVDGFPRPGLARLLTNPPERDFRVLTPAEFSPSSGVAHVRVLRTGSTTNAASVSFTTRDDTAKAGEDYVTQSGTIAFAPLEVSKEVTVPLLARPGVDARLWFKLELSNPSVGYTNITSTPIVIHPDLRIAADSLRPRGDGSIGVTLRGTVPGRWYRLESSTDLQNWESIDGNAASGSRLVFDSFLPKTSPQFYRSRTL